MTPGLGIGYGIGLNSSAPPIVQQAFDPANIPEMQFWAEARREVAYIDGDPVGIMTDQTINVNHATGAGANRPRFDTGILNGHSVYHFTTDDILSTIAPITTASLTLFVVFRASNNCIIAEMSVTTDPNNGWYLHTTTGASISEFKTASLNGSAKNLTAGWGADNAWRVVRVETRGTHASHELFINTINQNLTTHGGSNDDNGLDDITDTVYIGARSGLVLPLTGDIAAIGIASNISAQDLADTDIYLNDNYAIY